MGCGSKCAKFFLFAVNICIFLVGAVMLAIGIWIAVSPQTFLSNVLTNLNMAFNNNYIVTQLTALLLNNSLLIYAAYIMIAVGGFMFLVGFFGCCGACKDSSCLLILYVVVCVLSFLVVLAAGIVGAVYYNQLGTFIYQGFTTLQNQNFDGMYNSSNSLSLAWLYVQQGAKCCGLNGASDFYTNTTTATYWNSNMKRATCSANACFTTNVQVPISCCTLSTNGTVIDSTCPSSPQTSSSSFYSTSCNTAFVAPLVQNIQQYSAIVMGVTFGLAVFCLLATIAGTTLLRHIKNEESPKYTA